jgi:AraC-like DNA-binding protein
MRSHLDRFDDWPLLARTAQYRPAKLAHLTGFSLRQLERYFVERFAKAPRAWLKELHLREENLRLEAALGRLQQGHLVKTLAIDLGFKNPPAFCRKFKLRYGLTPLGFLGQERKKSL